jgi:cytochrome c553
MPRWMIIALLPMPLLAVPVDFARDIRPIFQEHCVKCHGAEKQSGGLRYDHRAGALAQGDSGTHAIIPGKTEQSQLLKRVASTSTKDQMPPKGERLSQEKVALLSRWIAEGAVWPVDEETVIAPTKVSSTHWSFQPLRKTVPPPVKDTAWARNGVDVFIQSSREAARLGVAPDAKAQALIRRMSYDLTGLPPTPREVEAFVLDHARDADAAARSLVERLLASPAYGERWGRHWMDWVRYADTAGDNSDYPIPQAYLYRNYIIDAFNHDVPYDRFLTEQIAGDLLPAKSQEERNRQIIATGYIAMARRFGSLVEGYPQHLTIEDTLDNMGRTMLGLTLSCARCHDHKFDPVSVRDYYGLYGIFASTRYPFPGIELFKAQRDFAPLIPEAEMQAKLKPFAPKTGELTAKLEKLLAKSEGKALENMVREAGASSDEKRRMEDELDAQYKQVRDAGETLAKHLKTLPPMPTAYAVREDRAMNARIQIKGEPFRRGAEVPRKFLDVLGGEPLPNEVAEKSSGRLQLALWITDPKNPLTARVIVNRVWQRHFGKGLVPSTSDFGLRGEKPTHPELLDWLAAEFMKNGWSIKQLHRLIMNSRTYRLSCDDIEGNLVSDPGNTRYWKANRLRLDAESIRDSLLTISGGLDPAPQTQPYAMPPVSKWGYTQHHPFKDDYPSSKRSVYLMTRRLTAKTYFQTFDGADPNVCTSSRDSSITAIQALYFVNDEFLHEQARGYVRKLMRETPDTRERLQRAFLTILSRPPTDDETKMLLSHLGEASMTAGSDDAAWASVIRSLFRLNEFLYLD